MILGQYNLVLMSCHQNVYATDLLSCLGKTSCLYCPESVFDFVSVYLSFADRQFYEDWWNSTSWDEFARKWNKPVHVFLARHVYTSSISRYGLSKKRAMFLTFFLSACLHELVMAIVTKKIRYVYL